MSKHQASRRWRLSPGQWATAAAAVALPVAAAFVVVGASRGYADDCCGGGAAKADGAKKDEGEAKGLLVNLGNAKCPVMGGKTTGKLFSEWNGLRVGHCCAMCSGKFAADPQKYLDAAGIDWKSAAAAAKRANEAHGADRVKALAELKKTWTVIREPSPVPPPQGTLIALGNTKCPVMGGEPDGETWSEWNGLRVGHCCPGCTKKFAADPAKCLDEAKIDWKAAADAARAVDSAKGSERAKALAAVKAKWTVVREPAAEPDLPAEPKKQEEPKK